MMNLKINREIICCLTWNNITNVLSFKDPKSFELSSSFLNRAIVKKNDWEYWNGEKRNGKIWNQCLKRLYYDNSVYWKTIKDLNEQKILELQFCLNPVVEKLI